MTVAEMIILVKRAYQMMMDTGQENGNIVIEIRRSEPRHVRFDLEVRPPNTWYNTENNNDLERQAHP